LVQYEHPWKILMVKTLMNPAHASAKLKNKTELLDDPVASLELAGRQSLEYLRPILGKAGLLL